MLGEANHMFVLPANRLPVLPRKFQVLPRKSASTQLNVPRDGEDLRGEHPKN